MTAKKISNVLRGLADPAIAEHSQRFFKTGKGEYGEGDQFLGIRVPVLRKNVKIYQTTALQEVQKLLKSSFHEERLFALLLLVHKSSNQFNPTAFYSCSFFYQSLSRYPCYDCVAVNLLRQIVNRFNNIDPPSYEVVTRKLQKFFGPDGLTVSLVKWRPYILPFIY